MDEEILQTYIEESREHLADIEQDLLTLEQGGDKIDETLVNKVFRAAHSIKGGAGFFDLSRIKDLAHRIENALDLMRSGKLVPNPEVINILLISFDKLRDLINNVSHSEEMDISEFVVALTGLSAAVLPQEEKKGFEENVLIPVPGSRQHFLISGFDLEQIKKTKKKVFILKLDLLHDVERKGRTPLTIFHHMDRFCVVMDSLMDFDSVGGLDDEPLNIIPLYLLVKSGIDRDAVAGIVEIEAQKVIPIDLGTLGVQDSKGPSASLSPAEAPPEEPAKAIKAAPVPETPALDARQVGDTSLRVQVHLLEQLMTLAGELVLARNQLTEAIRGNDLPLIKVAGQRVHGVTSELQEAVMKTRLQPLTLVFSKFPRLIRDMARSLGKDLRLQVLGEEVELDKTLIEALNDPLTHLVRNAADHGIEAPGSRVEKGKPPVGTVTLRAYHEAGQVNIEIEDDGKGLDTQRITEKALEKGLITPEQAKGFGEREKMHLIFLPGLSTAETVSEVSGRGVGMDVVKSNLEKLGGIVELDSQPGKGTRVRIKLPLTLAIIPSLLVTVGEDRFALPQVNVQELIRLRPQKIRDSVLKVGEAEVLHLRGEYIPLVSLTKAFAIERKILHPETGEELSDRRKMVADRRSRDLLDDLSPLPREGGDRRFKAGSDLSIVILSAGTFRYGLVVDKLHDTMEIVVKPLGRGLKSLKTYAGATIMGDGRIALILDVVGMAEFFKLQELAEFATQTTAKEKTTSDGEGSLHNLLLFRSGTDPCALPLGGVERVDTLDPGRIETLGRDRVVEYRGKPIILFQLEEAAKIAPVDWRLPLQILVMKAFGRTVGLVVNGPVEAVSERIVIDPVSLRQTGVAGSAHIKGVTTLIVDPLEVIEALHQDWEPLAAATRLDAGGSQGTTLLLAEDSDFFRKHMQGALQGAGYQVIAAGDGQEALELLNQHPEVRLIVSDIEMPRLDGLGLARAVRAQERTRSLPLLAVSSLASEEDQRRGLEAGFTAYQVKLDVDSLISTVKKLLAGGVP